MFVVRLAVALAMLVGALTASRSVGQEAGPPCRQETPIIPASRVEPGMRAVVRTVLKGSETEEFEAVVLGIVHSMTPGSGVILVRLPSERFKESGVIAGMSGSPVYVRSGTGGERLMGAIAYGFPFARDAIAGITPAEDLLDLRRLDVDAAEPVRDRKARADSWESYRARHASLVGRMERGSAAECPSIRRGEIWCARSCVCPTGRRVPGA